MDTARDASTWASSPERLCRYAGRRRYADLRTQENIGTDVDSTKDIDLGTDLTVDLTASRTRNFFVLRVEESGILTTIPIDKPCERLDNRFWPQTRSLCGPAGKPAPSELKPRFRHG